MSSILLWHSSDTCGVQKIKIRKYRIPTTIHINNIWKGDSYHNILINTNNATPINVGTVEFLYAVRRNSFTYHLILWLVSNKHHRSDWHSYYSVCTGRGKRPRVRSLHSTHSFVETWSWKKFYGHSPSSADSRRAVVSYWRKNEH